MTDPLPYMQMGPGLFAELMYSRAWAPGYRRMPAGWFVNSSRLGGGEVLDPGWAPVALSSPAQDVRDGVDVAPTAIDVARRNARKPVLRISKLGMSPNSPATRVRFDMVVDSSATRARATCRSAAHVHGYRLAGCTFRDRSSRGTTTDERHHHPSQLQHACLTIVSRTSVGLLGVEQIQVGQKHQIVGYLTGVVR